MSDLWFPDSWKAKSHAQEVHYEDGAALEDVVAKLRRLPPLVTSWEIERLKKLFAEAQTGKRFMLQGGDCAETLADCRPTVIANKLKILLQMSLVLIHGGQAAGHPRRAASPGSTRSRAASPPRRMGRHLPRYFGDLVNRPEFTLEAQARRPAASPRGLPPRGDDA